MEYPSKLIEDAVEEIAKLPGIGRKTALRLCLHLLKKEGVQTQNLARALVDLRTKTTYCTECRNISDAPLCRICSSTKRSKSIICVVEDVPALSAIENTAQYDGLYHVLGGLISPMNGVSPSDLTIEKLIERVEKNEIEEIIFALSATMEADTTAFYITKKLKPFSLKISAIARGIPIGSEPEYTDEVTLGRSIMKRIRYE